MSLFKSKSVISKVGDVDVEFFSLSIPVLFQLKSAITPAAKLISSFFRGGKKDVSRFQEESIDQNGKPVKIIQEQAITPEMAKLRAEQSAVAMKELIEAVFSDANRQLLGRVLMDSMRSNCPRRPSVQQIEEFLADLDLGQLTEMLQGVARANAEVFGPLGRQAMKQAQDLLRAQGSSESPTSDANAPNETQAVPPGQPPLRLVPKD